MNASWALLSFHDRMFPEGLGQGNHSKWCASADSGKSQAAEWFFALQQNL
jgi:hypothetical protein